MVERTTLLAIHDQYESIHNVKNDLVFICQEHILRFDLLQKKKQRFNSDRNTRHLRFFKAKNGDELELVEENQRLVLKQGNQKKVARSQPIEGIVESGNVEMSKLHEYATGMNLDVVIVSYRVILSNEDRQNFPFLGDSLGN